MQLPEIEEMIGKDITKLYKRILDDFKACIDAIGKVFLFK